MSNVGLDALVAELRRLTAERDTARAETAMWHADANLMLGFAELAYEAGAMPSSSELIAARDRALAADRKAVRRDMAERIAIYLELGGTLPVTTKGKVDAILALIEKETPHDAAHYAAEEILRGVDRLKGCTHGIEGRCLTMAQLRQIEAWAQDVSDDPSAHRGYAQEAGHA